MRHMAFAPKGDAVRLAVKRIKGIQHIVMMKPQRPVPAAAGKAGYSFGISSNSIAFMFQWWYFRKGVEKMGKKCVKVHVPGSQQGSPYEYVESIVKGIASYVEEYTIPGEAMNARLTIYKFEGAPTQQQFLLHDLRMPVRLMNRVKKMNPIING